MNYLDVEQAIDAPGLRLVLSAGVPGPWGEAAKSIFAWKGLDFVAVRQDGGGENAALRAWTGQDSAPVAVFEQLPPVSHWLDLLHLAERLAPGKPLLPADAAGRADAQGLSAMIAGVDGFGWQRRLQMFAPAMAMPEPPAPIARMAAKYGWSPAACEAATGKLQGIAALLDERLAAQESKGSPYFVGDSLTAVDFYWANFAAMVAPLPADVNPMPEFMRSLYEPGSAVIRALLTPRLEAHRNLMYRDAIALPLDF
ncbi:MAG TPA: hypothetical protein VIC02_08035 [Kineobactrum sp.]